MFDVYEYDDMVGTARLACIGLGLRSAISDTQRDVRHLLGVVEHRLRKQFVSSALEVIFLSLQVLDTRLNICHALSCHGNDP